MNDTPGEGPSKIELEELTLLLENRTFVDYFNTFLCLPVFGQHVFYNFMEMEFEFEPPIKTKRNLYLDRREVLRWLCTERMRQFKKSSLYSEYRLCLQLRSTGVDLPGVAIEKDQDPAVVTRNIIGTVRGMMLFRESLRGTGGENVYRCWKDIETWRLTDDPVRKQAWKRTIFSRYINENSDTEVVSNIKVKVFHGILNFDLVPETEIMQQILDSVTNTTFHTFTESDDSLLNLQTIQLCALRKYWLPRHLLHVLQQLTNEALNVLTKPVPGDVEYVGHERRFRCGYMFPNIEQELQINSPATTVILSQSANDLHINPSITEPVLSPESECIEEETKRSAEPGDLLSLWGGQVKEIETKCESSLSSPSLPDMTTSDNNANQKKQLTSDNLHVRSPIPLVLASYIGGMKRVLFGKFPSIVNMFAWSLASDSLAGGPFQQYLEQNWKYMDLKYFEFWTEVKKYLDADEHEVDRLGQCVKLQLAHKIANTYLTRDNGVGGIFSENLKMSLFTAISTGNDLSLLCMAQDIVEKNLKEPLLLYTSDERERFRKQVLGDRCKLNSRQRRAIDHTTSSRVKSARSSSDIDPEYFFNCVTLDIESSPPYSEFPTMPSDSPMSCPETSCETRISEEQMLKAMELTVLCSEYGEPMMMPQNLMEPSQLVQILYSDYGSLHLIRVPTVRHEWLRSLLEKPKIDIESIKVSREVLLDKIDISSLKKEDDVCVPRSRGRMVRRAGITVERPPKPKSLIEVLTTPVQFEYFKRFMTMHKVTMPLLFWKAVEDLQEMSNGKLRQIRVTQILRKFFGKHAKYGASLYCDEEIIRQIPNLEKVTPGILMCAQAAVFRTIERKWYPNYCDTFPPDSAKSSQNSISFSIRTGIVKNFEEAAKFVDRTKKVKKRTLGSRRTLALWKNFSTALTTFVKATNSRGEMQLFEMFLKYEVEREKQSPQKDPPSQLPHNDRSTMMANVTTNVQTRIVICNRLIIMNRLPADLRFWLEIIKYQTLVDSASKKQNVSALETEFLTDKAKSIIACFLNSEISPRVQVNIPNDMASNIITSLASDGPKRGSFHDAMILIFPILYHFYRKFSNDWMKGNIPDEYFDSIEQTIHGHVASTPHENTKVPDYTSIDTDQIKTSTVLALDESTMKIHFSISEGMTLIFPQLKLHKSPTTVGRRMTKHSIHALNEKTSLHKATKGGHGDKKESKHSLKSGEKRQKNLDGKRLSGGSIKERKKSEKIVVKESEQSPQCAGKERQGSIDKARRLSFLVDSLNKEKEAKIKEQNRLFSKLMSFNEVVSAALAELSEPNSTLSLNESPSIKS